MADNDDDDDADDVASTDDADDADDAGDEDETLEAGADDETLEADADDETLEAEAEDETQQVEADDTIDAPAAEADDDGDDSGDDDDDNLDLPSVDDDVFGSHTDWAGAAAEDFEDDAGDWSTTDYLETAETLFGDHEHWGDTSHQQYLDEGFSALLDDHPVVANIRDTVPDSTVRFYERDGEIVPRGFLTSIALAALEAAFPDLDTSFLHVTVPRHPLDTDDARPPQELPDAIRNLDPADSVDLRKYATPIGDQGSTSRCAAFAWTHALELLGVMRGQPFPRLACSYTMYGFQQRQGDAKDFRWAWKGGDGTSGTWEPGHHLFTTGTCRHELWPDDDDEPATSLAAMQDDARGHVIDADVYDVSVDDMKKLLSSGLPVQISMTTGDAFQDIGRDGVMKVSEAPKGRHGFHAMLCVGYVGNYFIVKNSWGTDWGENGYCYIPKMVLAESEPEAVAIIPKKPGAAPPPPPSAPPKPAVRVGAAAPPAPSFGLASHACRQCGAPRGFGVICSKCGFNNG